MHRHLTAYFAQKFPMLPHCAREARIGCSRRETALRKTVKACPSSVASAWMFSGKKTVLFPETGSPLPARGREDQPLFLGCGYTE